MSTHTPGPWKVAQITHNSQLKSHERRGYAGSIAYVYTDRPYPQGICVASVREELLGEVGANAQLIAAAPDMLKALQRAAALAWFTVATMPEGSLRDDAIYTHTLIRNALNKAGKGTQ